MEALSVAGSAETANQEVGRNSEVEVISHEGETIAMIIRDSFSSGGVNFITPREFPQQVAYMEHPAGKVIDAHVHGKVVRQIECTQEVIFVKRGRILVRLYTADREYLENRVLDAGDVILLASGGHGFEMLEDASFIEVKQGPYVGEHDKVRFTTARLNRCAEVNGNLSVELGVKESAR